jgi:hypothetical protein
MVVVVVVVATLEAVVATAAMAVVVVAVVVVVVVVARTERRGVDQRCTGTPMRRGLRDQLRRWTMVKHSSTSMIFETCRSRERIHDRCAVVAAGNQAVSSAADASHGRPAHTHTHTAQRRLECALVESSEHTGDAARHGAATHRLAPSPQSGLISTRQWASSMPSPPPLKHTLPAQCSE